MVVAVVVAVINFVTKTGLIRYKYKWVACAVALRLNVMNSLELVYILIRIEANAMALFRSENSKVNASLSRGILQFE